METCRPAEEFRKKVFLKGDIYLLENCFSCWEKFSASRENLCYQPIGIENPSKYMKTSLLTTVVVFSSLFNLRFQFWPIAQPTLLKLNFKLADWGILTITFLENEAIDIPPGSVEQIIIFQRHEKLVLKFLLVGCFMAEMFLGKI